MGKLSKEEHAALKSKRRKKFHKKMQTDHEFRNTWYCEATGKMDDPIACKYKDGLLYVIESSYSMDPFDLFDCVERWENTYYNTIEVVVYDTDNIYGEPESTVPLPFYILLECVAGYGNDYLNHKMRTKEKEAA